MHVLLWYLCPSFLFGIEGGMWDVIVLIPDHCLSITFLICVLTVCTAPAIHIFKTSMVIGLELCYSVSFF